MRPDRHPLCLIVYRLSGGYACAGDCHCGDKNCCSWRRQQAPLHLENIPATGAHAAQRQFGAARAAFEAQGQHRDRRHRDPSGGRP